MYQPDISYIVSAYDRPELLPCVLWSIAGQTHRNFEVIVTDNSQSREMVRQQKKIVADMRDKRFRYVNTGPKIKVSDPYWSAEWAVKHEATGEWLCFPCDDCYYVPDFASRMLFAANSRGWDYVTCNLVMKPYESKYIPVEPDPARPVKTAMLVKSEVFPGFHGKAAKSEPAAADQVLGLRMIQAGVRYGVVPEIMVVHN